MSALHFTGGRSMFSVLKYSGKYKKNTITAIVFLLIAVPVSLIPYFIAGSLIGEYLDGTVTVSGILVAAGIILGCLVARHVCYGIGLSQSHKGAFGTLLNIRTKLAKDLSKQPLGEILDGGTGKYKKGFVEEIGRLELILAHVIPEGLGNLVAPVLVITAVFILDWRMGFLSIVTIPAGFIAMNYMMKIGLKKMPDYYKAGTRLNNTVVEYVSGMEVIKIFGQTTSSFKKYGSAVENYKKFTLDWYKDCWKSMAVTYSVLPCTVLLTLPLGIVFYLNGTLELSTWIMILLLDLSLATPLTKVINFIPMFPQVGYTLKTIESIFDVPDVQSGGRTEKPNNFDVTFDNVTFAYRKKTLLKT